MTHHIYKLITAVLCTAFVAQGGWAAEKDETPSDATRRKVDYFYLEGLNRKYAGEYAEASELFQHCISLDSTAAAPLYELAVYALQLRKPELSLDYLRRAVKYDPTNCPIRCCGRRETVASILMRRAVSAWSTERWWLRARSPIRRPSSIAIVSWRCGRSCSCRGAPVNCGRPVSRVFETGRAHE